jgi:DNA-binding transcriptional LysR family regulator
MYSEELGMRLLDRTKQRVSLTREGASFLVDAKRVLDLSEEIVESARGASRRESPPLNIGYVANLFFDLLPVTLIRSRKNQAFASGNSSRCFLSECRSRVIRVIAAG